MANTDDEWTFEAQRWAVAMVRRMWRDGIVAPQYADVETVVRLAPIEGDADKAADVLEGVMVDRRDVPVYKGGRGVVTLVPDEDAVVEFFAKYALNYDDVPPDLRDEVRERVADGDRE